MSVTKSYIQITAKTKGFQFMKEFPFTKEGIASLREDIKFLENQLSEMKK